jgi:hypothetical protein
MYLLECASWRKALIRPSSQKVSARSAKSVFDLDNFVDGKVGRMSARMPIQSRTSRSRTGSLTLERLNRSLCSSTPLTLSMNSLLLGHWNP